MVRFVHSDFKEHTSMAELAALFPSARDSRADAMTLREIFLAIAKSSRGVAQQQSNSTQRQEVGA